LTIEGLLGDVKVGDLYPVRTMAVINLGRESFYKGSIVGVNQVLKRAQALVDEGAEILDIGAVSTAPGSPPISEEEERIRLIPALKDVLENLDVQVSVDTYRAGIADLALSMGASCVNDVSGLLDPSMADVVADHDRSIIIMASGNLPGDLLTMDEAIEVLGTRLKLAEDAGIFPKKIIVDPGIGHWISEKLPHYDLALLDGLRRLRVLNRPVLGAISRKSFIGSLLNKIYPEERLAGSLAATAIAVYNGAHIVRTHDVSSSQDVIRIAEAVRARPCLAQMGEITVEVCEHLNHPQDLKQSFNRIMVGDGGSKALSGKGSYRLLSVQGITSMESVIIKQEMLTRGGDAAIPMGALRCDPGNMEVLVLGTVAQIKGLIKNLKSQPFNLPLVGDAISMALEKIEDPLNYR